MTKNFQDETLFGFSNFCHLKLFDICNLIFVISIIQWTSNKVNPLWDRLFTALLRSDHYNRHCRNNEGK